MLLTLVVAVQGAETQKAYTTIVTVISMVLGVRGVMSAIDFTTGLKKIIHLLIDWHD